MARRSGWLLLAVVSAALALLTLVGGLWSAGAAIAYGSVIGAIGPLAGTAFSVLFWRWIGLGAWERAHPQVDPETGRPLPPGEEVGPWGWVGRAMLALILIAFIGGGTWATIAGRHDDQRRADLQDRVERTAKRSGLTIDRIDAAVLAHKSWLLTADDGATGVGPDPLDALLRVPGTTVEDASAEADRAAILVRPDEGPPCIVVDLDVNDLVSTRQTSRC